MNKTLFVRGAVSGALAVSLAGAGLAQTAPPADLLPPAQATPRPIPTTPQPLPAPANGVPADTAMPQAISEPVVQDIAPLVQSWTVGQAEALLAVIEGIGAEGLIPADYDPAGLRAAIAAGAGPELDEVASQSLVWLIEDIRDGRTPMEARRQWFVVDPDPDLYPTGDVMAEALASGDIAGTLAGLHSVHPDYVRLREELAKTPKSETKKRRLIQANMDRWRWLARDLGSQYLMTNVPEYQLRLTVNDKIIRTYRTIVGKPGRTATPQLAETVEGIIFNPTWTVPQSIVKGEGLGAKVLGNPSWARSQGYKGWKDPDTGFVTVVQQPGPKNALGLMKLDMPNEHAIFLHDTPSRNLFNQANRALSHGCIRTERASELAITLAILQAGLTADEGVAHVTSGEYTRVPFTKTMPVYITYFTMAQDIEGKLSTFADIYGRDAPVLASFDKPRVAERARVTDEEVVPLEAPGA